MSTALQLIVRNNGEISDVKVTIEETGTIIEETEMIIEEKEMIIEEKETIIEEKEMIIEETGTIIEEKETIIEEKAMIIEETGTIIEETGMVGKKGDMMKGITSITIEIETEMMEEGENGVEETTKDRMIVNTKEVDYMFTGYFYGVSLGNCVFP